MGREPLYSQHDENEVNGHYYALGNTLADDVDDETRAELIRTGKFSTTNPYAGNPA